MIPGPCKGEYFRLYGGVDSLADSDWIEWNDNGVSPCYINLWCSILLTLKDSSGNLIPTQVLSRSSLDSLLVGPFSSPFPHSTLYVQNLTAFPPYYYINYKRYYVGQYNLYVRFREDKAP